MSEAMTTMGTTEWESALERFCYWKRVQGASERTVSDYLLHVRLFFRKYCEDLTSPTLKQALLEYLAQPVAPSTFNIRLQNIKAFLSWCVREGLVTANPLEGLKKRKADPRIVEIDNDVVKQLLRLPDRRTFAGLRDYSFLLLTLDTGLRPHEAASLRCEDVNLKGLEVRIRAEVAKTRTSRTLPISPITAQTIRELTQSRSPLWSSTVPLLCSASGTPLSRFVWDRRVKGYGRQLGVTIRPYDLRHFFALAYLRAGGNAFSLQRTLGHTDLSMTRRYVALTSQDLRDIHAAATPLNALQVGTARIRKIGSETKGR